MEKNTEIIISWHNGNRTDEDFKILLKLMETIPLNKYYTDDWGAYSRLLPAEKLIDW